MEIDCEIHYIIFNCRVSFQVGSHYHFVEVNPSLVFDRRKALGMRLNIPAGTATRFEVRFLNLSLLFHFSETLLVRPQLDGVCAGTEIQRNQD